jgi:hypothetical protein
VPKTGGPEVADDTDLYAVVPEQFVAARDALVRRLRSGGDKAEAARVAKLRRPPLTTWALNQVARDVPTLVEELLDAGAVLRCAMEKALRGDASELRPARAGERSAGDAILVEAGRRLDEGGYRRSGVMSQRMAATLRAAIVDGPVAVLLQRGVLDGDREAPGFGLDSRSGPLCVVPPVVGGGAGVVSADGGGQAQGERTERGRRGRAAVEEAGRLAAEAGNLAVEADRLAREADRLSSEALAARKQADGARSRADAARQAADAQRAVADDFGSVAGT